MSHLAEIRRWIAMDDYEAIGAFLDKNRDLDELDVQYLNQHVPQEKKETWNDFVENGMCIIIDVSKSNTDVDRMIRVDISPDIASGGVWSYIKSTYYTARITLETLQATPFGNKVPCSIENGSGAGVGIYQAFDVLVGHNQNVFHLRMYHNQTFKFNL